MVRIFYKEKKQIRKENDVRMLSQIPNVIWVDLQSPSPEEEEWIESKCQVSFQTPQEIVEIESSARFFEQGDMMVANSNFSKIDQHGYHSYPVSFLIKNTTLFTYRQGDSKTFADTVKKMRVYVEPFETGIDIFLLLLETRIEADADLLENMSREITNISKSLSNEKKPKQEILLKINTLQENSMMLRESIIDKQRVLSSIQRSRLFPESYRERLRIVLKDISSLTEYTTFNFERLEYLQDTFTGLINLEQNQIIKIFTVVTIVFLPPTLIAGIFGMNYQVMPTILHPYGFYLALILMMLSSTAVLWFFKRKHWI
ncbi:MULTISPECIES: magnesium/cobalt transporter CorA [Bacteroidota]|uniref:Magnesium transport protein CorA n=3 Tax=Flectobacillus TaxID=101 RepID=A0ABT6YY18_9BACT|nr:MULTISPECIES: magnesium/cobalt transporter CorA [Bacteroidota]NBA78516.1 magnesium/cobalt transporter CorA [Emticicia sp. ODNR4P]MDI9859258.1 magnesium/cobalt transporter CorA [Flectobacillus roseus]MDI9868045.1 magnesium/cobalt transporter CorA [Flectobacillus roseus]MDI9873670.1 magnesium/cobalt transporter CorA [Flectobacillus rivi]NBB31558.1 magnesium/cobalt transporter CorA [Cellulophaga sp. BC115SP]